MISLSFIEQLNKTDGALLIDPLVAYGRLNDVLDLSAGYPLIASRKFIVERILSPVHFKPTMLPLLA